MNAGKRESTMREIDRKGTGVGGLNGLRKERSIEKS